MLSSKVSLRWDVDFLTGLSSLTTKGVYSLVLLGWISFWLSIDFLSTTSFDSILSFFSSTLRSISARLFCKEASASAFFFYSAARFYNIFSFHIKVIFFYSISLSSFSASLFKQISMIYVYRSLVRVRLRYSISASYFWMVDNLSDYCAFSHFYLASSNAKGKILSKLPKFLFSNSSDSFFHWSYSCFLCWFFCLRVSFCVILFFLSSNILRTFALFLSTDKPRSWKVS